MHQMAPTFQKNSGGACPRTPLPQLWNHMNTGLASPLDVYRIVTEISWYVSRYSVVGDTQPYWFRVSSVVIAVFVIAMCRIDCDFSWIRFWGRISKFHSNDVWVGYCSSALLRIYDLLAHIDLFVFQCMRILSAQTEYHVCVWERERERERERVNNTSVCSNENSHILLYSLPFLCNSVYMQCGTSIIYKN